MVSETNMRAAVSSFVAMARDGIHLPSQTGRLLLLGGEAPVRLTGEALGACGHLVMCCRIGHAPSLGERDRSEHTCAGVASGRPESRAAGSRGPDAAGLGAGRGRHGVRSEAWRR